MEDVSVGIIGGGPTGLISLYECKIRNIKATLYEKEDDTGGIWNFKSSSPYGHRSTMLNTSSYVSSLQLDFPLYEFIRKKYPSKNVDFLTSTDYNEYLNAFIKYYQLDKMIQVGKEVIEINSESNKIGFQIKVRNSTNGQEETYKHNYVIVGSGFLKTRVVPEDPFLSKDLKMNNDSVWHSSYWDPLNSESLAWNICKQEKLTLIVIGGGHSAAEAIQDTITRFKNDGNYEKLKVYWAPTREPKDRTIWMLDRYPFVGKEAQVTWDERDRRYTYYFPISMINNIFKKMCTNLSPQRQDALFNFDKDRVCICKTGIVKKGLEDNIVHIMPDPVCRIYGTETGQVVFDTSNINSIPVDVVVIGSGFTSCEPKIDGKDILKTSDLYHHIIPVDKNLYGQIGFICKREIFGSNMTSAQMEVRWLLHQWFDNKNKNFFKYQSQSKNQHTKYTNKIPGFLVDSLAIDMKIKPKILRGLFSLWYRQRHLSLAYIFGPWTIYQYHGLNETYEERIQRENVVLSETARIYKKCGKSFQFVCLMSDAVYYINVAAICLIAYKNYEFALQKLSNIFHFFH